MKYYLSFVLFWLIYLPVHIYFNNEIPISDYTILLNHPFCIETMPFVQECTKDGIVSRNELLQMLQKDKENKHLINKQAFINEVKAR